MESAKDVRDKPAPPAAKVYTEAEKKAALELAASIGLKPAADELGIGRATIFRWRNQMPAYWHSLLTGDQAAQQHKIADNLEDLADAYAQGERIALERIVELLEAEDEEGKPALDAKEIAALTKAMGSSRGVANAGARAVRGNDQPSLSINVNILELEKAMERLLSGATNPALPAGNPPDAITVEPTASDPA